MASQYRNLPVIGLMPHQMEYMIKRQKITGNAFASKIRDLVQNDMDNVHVPGFILEMSKDLNSEKRLPCFDLKCDCSQMIELRQWIMGLTK